MCFQNKPKHVLASWFYMLFVFGVWGWLDCWTVIGCLPEARGFCECGIMLTWSWLFLLNHGNVMIFYMMSVFISLITILVSMWDSEIMLWDIWLNHFESSISIIGILFGCSLRTDGYCDLSFDAFQSLV